MLTPPDQRRASLPAANADPRTYSGLAAGNVYHDMPPLIPPPVGAVSGGGAAYTPFSGGGGGGAAWTGAPIVPPPPGATLAEARAWHSAGAGTGAYSGWPGPSSAPAVGMFGDPRQGGPNAYATFAPNYPPANPHHTPGPYAAVGAPHQPYAAPPPAHCTPFTGFSAANGNGHTPAAGHYTPLQNANGHAQQPPWGQRLWDPPGAVDPNPAAYSGWAMGAGNGLLAPTGYPVGGGGYAAMGEGDVMSRPVIPPEHTRPSGDGAGGGILKRSKSAGAAAKKRNRTPKSAHKSLSWAPPVYGDDTGYPPFRYSPYGPNSEMAVYGHLLSSSGQQQPYWPEYSRDHEIDTYGPEKMARRPRDWRPEYTFKSGLAAGVKATFSAKTARSDVKEFKDPVSRNIHPLLAYNPGENGVGLEYDLRVPVWDQVKRGTLYTRMNRAMNRVDFSQMATMPAAGFMRLYHPNLPFVIDVTTDLKNGVSVFDVLQKIFVQINQQIRGRHYWTEALTSGDRRALETAFSERVVQFAGEPVGSDMWNRGFCQIDFLGAAGRKFIFEGLVKGKNGTWEMKIRKVGSARDVAVQPPGVHW